MLIEELKALDGIFEKSFCRSINLKVFQLVNSVLSQKDCRRLTSFFLNSHFSHFWRAICARTGSRFMRRKFNYAQFGLIEELKARFEYLRKVFGRSENLSSFDEFF